MSKIETPTRWKEFLKDTSSSTLSCCTQFRLNIKHKILWLQLHQNSCDLFSLKTFSCHHQDFSGWAVKITNFLYTLWNQFNVCILLVLCFKTVIQHVSDGEVSPRPSISYPFGTSTTDQTISPISSQLQTSDKPSANANYKSAVKTNSSESDFLTGVMRDAPAGDASSANKDEVPSEKPSTSENPLASKQPTDALQLTQQVLLRKGYPYIDIATSPNVTALLGKTAYLTCRVKNIGDKTVSNEKCN